MDNNAGERTINKLIRLSAERTPAHRRLAAYADAAHIALEETATACFGIGVEVQKKNVVSRAQPAGVDCVARQAGVVWRFCAPDDSVRLIVSVDLRGVLAAADAYLGENPSEEEAGQTDVRTVTEIDKRLAQMFVVDFVAGFARALDQPTEQAGFERLTMARVEPSDFDLQLASGRFASASFDIAANARISLGALDLYFEANTPFETPSPDRASLTDLWKRKLRNAVMRTPIRLSAILARKDFCISGLWRLRRGDVLEMDCASLDEVMLDRERGIGQPVLSGALVSSGQNRALVQLKPNLM